MSEERTLVERISRALRAPLAQVERDNLLAEAIKLVPSLLAKNDVLTQRAFAAERRLAEVRAEEREACAKIAASLTEPESHSDMTDSYNAACREIASAIRNQESSDDAAQDVKEG